MAGSRVYMMGFDEGTKLEEKQRFALGQIGQDRLGNRWSYVQFTNGVQLTAGQWVQDILQAENPAVSDSPNELVIATSALTANRQYVGAYGFVTGATGRGQGFMVTGKYVSGANTHFTIRLLHDGTSPQDTEQWETPLKAGATSAVTFSFTGVVDTGGAAGGLARIRGVVQTTVPVSTQKFGWVQQSGVGLCLLNQAGTNVPNTGLLIPDADGLFEGGSTNPVARALVTYNPTANALVLAELRVDNFATSLLEAPPQRPIGIGGEVLS